MKFYYREKNLMLLVVVIISVTSLQGSATAARAQVRHLVENKKISALKFRNVPATHEYSNGEDSDTSDDQVEQTSETFVSQTPSWSSSSSSTISTKTPNIDFPPSQHDESTDSGTDNQDYSEPSTTTTSSTSDGKTSSKNTASPGTSAIFERVQPSPQVEYVAKFYNFSQILADVSAAMYRSNDDFRSFLDKLYEILNFNEFNWRQLGESCSSLPTEDTENIFVRTIYGQRTWPQIFMDRDNLVNRYMKLVKASAGITEQSPEIDPEYEEEERKSVQNPMELIQNARRAMGSKASERQLRKMIFKLSELRNSISMYCNPFKYLSCNLVFDGQRDGNMAKAFYEHRGGQCDCRDGFEVESNSCVVKHLEDCNLGNLRLATDLKTIPWDVLKFLRRPMCGRGHQCVNNFVCMSAGSRTIYSSVLFCASTYFTRIWA